MTFLYNKLGQLVPQPGAFTPTARISITKRWNIYAIAVELNEQQGIKDPGPYLGIGRAYAQLGEF